MNGQPARRSSLILGLAAWAVALLLFGLVQIDHLLVDRPLALAGVYGYTAITFTVAGAVGLIVLRTQRVGLLTFAGAQVFWFAWPALKHLVAGRWIAEGMGYYYLLDRDVLATCVNLLSFATLAYATYALVAARFRDDAPADPAIARGLDEAQLTRIVAVLVAFGVLPFLVYGESLQAVIQGMLGSRADIENRTWAQSAFESRPLYVMGRAALVTAGAVSLHQFLSGWSRPRAPLWFGAFAFAFLVTYFDSGTRSWTAMILVPGVLERIRASLAGRGTVRAWLVIAPVVLLATLWLAQLQLAFRNTGVNRDILAEGGTLQVDDNDFFSETAVAVSLVPRHMDYVYESSLVLFATNPIPRSLWANKPYPRVVENYGIGRLGGLNEFRETGVSRMPSIVGQYHMSWGTPGVMMIGATIGGFLALLDGLARSRRATSITQIGTATAFVWLFVSHRGLFPGFHYPVLILALVALYERYGGTTAARTLQPRDVHP